MQNSQLTLYRRDGFMGVERVTQTTHGRGIYAFGTEFNLRSDTVLLLITF